MSSNEIAKGIAAADKFLKGIQEKVYEAFSLPDPDTVSNGATGDVHEDGTPAGPPAKMDAPRPRGFDF